MSERESVVVENYEWLNGNFTGTINKDGVPQEGEIAYKSYYALFKGVFNKDGKPQKGEMTFQDGVIFRGTFYENGIPLEGIMQIKKNENENEVFNLERSGKTRIGSVVYDNYIRSRGTMTYENGNIFYGTFYGNGMPREGEMIYENGNRLRVMFNEDGILQEGEMTFQDGVIFRGTFDENGMPQEGEITYGKNDNKLKGKFNEDGEFIDRDGYIYRVEENIIQENPIGRIYTNGRFEGTFYEDGRPQEGEMTFLNGNIFNGTFSKNGTLQEGIMQRKIGNNKYKTSNITNNGLEIEIASAEYKNASRNTGTMVCRNGDIFYGTFYGNGMPQEGIMIDQNENISKAIFSKNGTPQKGIKAYRNGDMYYGTFYGNGMPQEGMMKCRNGNIYSGTFYGNGRQQNGHIMYMNKGESTPYEAEVNNGRKSRKEAKQLTLDAMIDVKRELDNHILQRRAEVGMD